MNTTVAKRTAIALVLTISMTVTGLTISNASGHPAKAPIPAKLTGQGGGGRTMAE